MAYDEQLAERVRAAVAGRDDINEKPLSLAFVDTLPAK
jgi:hypothetical protein